MAAAKWFRMLGTGRPSIHAKGMRILLGVSFASLVNSLLAASQRVLLGRRIAATPVRDDPIFVLGHWRSGTTLLHELLSHDPRHTSPDLYACLAPEHFLVSRRLVSWWLPLVIPKKRPMDNVAVGHDRPQEDEWALCAMGIPTPYKLVAFPRGAPHDLEYFDLARLNDQARERWENGWMQFLKCLAVESDKRMVLKSPLHTCRIDTILKRFPRARFIHIARHPFNLYPSTVRLWRRLSEEHGLQHPDEEILKEFVLDSLPRMYQAYWASRQNIPAGQLCEIRYEDLVRNPVEQVRQIYDDLDLGDFGAAEAAVRRYTSGLAEYQTNQFTLSADERDLVAERWDEYFSRFDYSTEATCRAANAA
jgi:hypothetical protein